MPLSLIWEALVCDCIPMLNVSIKVSNLSNIDTIDLPLGYSMGLWLYVINGALVICNQWGIGYM